MIENRLRIAPSPTGNPHVGTAFIGIMNMIFAKSLNGKLILRIEDTDASRSKIEFEKQIYQALTWVGITWDEGPDIGGKFGPYRQSERLEIYKKYVNEIMESGYAYKCFCTEDSLKASKNINKQFGVFGYDKTCRFLSDEDIRIFENKNMPYVIRLKIPKNEIISWEDGIKGTIEFSSSEIDDQILIKSDGMPTYHFANVIDDHLMKITHVLRGEEWISSTPKHIILYRAFGWTPPRFYHLPLLLNPNGKKLSKRHGQTSIEFYKKRGYLPNALCNFLTSISYTMKEGDEIYNLNKIIDQFDINNISKSSAIFDTKKLDWINKKYISDMSSFCMFSQIITWLNKNNIIEALNECIPRMTVLSDFMFMIAPLYGDPKVVEASDISDLFDGEIGNAIIFLESFVEVATNICWDKTYIKNVVQNISQDLSLDFKKQSIPLLFHIIYGMRKGLPVFWGMEFIGKDMTILRINNAIYELKQRY